MNPNEASLWDVIDDIRSTDGRYRREAYLFVVASLGATVQALPPERLDDPIRRHLSGQELLRGVVRLARSEFGALAAAVFGEWGVRHGEDVGNIVFHLVSRGQLSARPEDTIEDFRNGIDLLEVLASEHHPFPERGDPRPRSGRKWAGPELGT
jgi:uncharacterized repeat protein (TIGR04138 family)